MSDDLTVRALATDDVGRYLQHMLVVNADSGVDGASHSHPYGKAESVDPAEAHDREITRWTTAIDEPGWRRAWGLFDGDDLVGHVYLAGGAILSELHRASLGMGIARQCRRRGGGTRLLAAAVGWAREQSSIDWVDLGVFTDNPGARALYEREGFEVVGRTPDRYRVDGVSLDEVSMTLTTSADRTTGPPNPP